MGKNFCYRLPQTLKLAASIKIDETYAIVHRSLPEHKQVGALDCDETQIIFSSYFIHDSDR